MIASTEAQEVALARRINLLELKSIILDIETPCEDLRSSYEATSVSLYE